MCRVMPLVLARDWKKCSTSCVSKVPMRPLGMSRSMLRCGRPERSCMRGGSNSDKPSSTSAHLLSEDISNCI